MLVKNWNGSLHSPCLVERSKVVWIENVRVEASLKCLTDSVLTWNMFGFTFMQERLMLNTLQFNMSIPAPYVFLIRYLKAAQSDRKEDYFWRSGGWGHPTKGLGREHEIDDEIRTPIRNHIKFPDDGQNKKRQALELLLSKRKVLQKERTLASTDASRKRTLGKV